MKTLMISAGLLCAITLAVVGADEAKPANLLPAEPDAAWQEVEKASKPPVPPAEWASKPPTQEQRKEFYKFLGSGESSFSSASDFSSSAIV